MFFDPLFLLMLAPALILSIWAQFRVKSTFSKFSKVRSSSGLTGAQVAEAILQANGVGGVRIEPVHGMLSDHYDPSKRVLRLSEAVYGERSVAAAGIAAHEVGHALQHKAAYSPLVLRQTLAPAAIAGSNFAYIVIFLGFILSMSTLVWAGIGLFTLAVVFSLVTLPVEFDASRRAKAALQQIGLVSGSDRDGVSTVLNAAAMTYVAAAVSAILTLLYYVLRAQGSRD
ncbi:MAG: zinc metallopeptidase [Deltaproteobacteria bacterium]|nr:zinc metallopeptidase [Deltaproteobacteria bacterium]